jgi:thiamine biosynthesis protein ThiI
VTDVVRVEPSLEGRSAILVRYAEIFLKGRNRRRFEDLLAKNVARALRGLGRHQVETHHGRILVFGPGGAEALRRLEGVFGISSFSPSTVLPLDVDRIEERALELGREAVAAGATSFRIEARRTDKAFPLTSPQINVRVGQRVKDDTGLKVDLESPGATIGIEIGERRAFVWGRSVRGPGGLPVGSGGKALLLLSGGIDSPVAGHLAQKRGLTVAACYFHSSPYTGPGAREKVLDLARLLAPAQGEVEVLVVPFTKIQERLRDGAPPRLLVVLYRRMMMRIAERLAETVGARAVVTGESLGQVASQTLESLDVIGRATRMPILRPLVTYDKVETIDVARRIGTYETSIRPFDDCCSLFVPPHPETRPKLRPVEAVESRLQVEAWADEAAGAAERTIVG